ncbi:MAG: hypothetical protein ACREJT_01375 [Myxococcota bacterium]
MRFELATFAFDQQNLVAAVEEFLRDGSADIACAGYPDACLAVRHPHIFAHTAPLRGGVCLRGRHDTERRPY